MHIENLDEKQAMLAAIIENSEDAIISKNLDGRITSWNRSAERMFGYTENDALGQLIYIIIPQDRHQEEAMIISKLKKGERVEHFETVRRAKNGKLIHVAISVSPIKNGQGQIVGASKIARDITQQKQYEERLQLMHSIGKVISAQLDVSTILQKVTDATTLIAGAAFGAFFYNKTDSKGEAYTLYALSGAKREDFDKFGMPRNTAVFKATFEGEGIVRSDDITKDPRYGKNAPHQGMPQGHLPVVSYLAVPVLSQGGLPIGGLFFGHPEAGVFNEEHETLVASIASQAAIALDNAKLYEEVNILSNKKDTFIGFASHELKTPLTTIKGYLQLAEASEISAKEILPKVSKQLARLEGIIADLLDISKIQAGKLDLHFNKSSLKEILVESIESVDFTDHMIELDHPSEDVELFADQQKITQVLVNLLSNAVKYSPAETRITVSALLMGDEVQISVSDEGEGISKEHLTSIFNQYYRVSSGKKTPKGMGLGLYISKEIIEGHLGKIWAESEQGKGSSFHIRFPVERPRYLNS
ncbi:PAS domain S-box protein [Terrimonas sp. NA20]|uniref:histidine kinase n=1 Tax=Terrimonas ginsenosidimutans TaxID=2908004 RepID=A0ABS9KYI2_9BACT|nr:PAS domain S-box protein [Terrimonas ginsenosidimutans]MCG2617412.1 PAS domain S-box protein [Terrimonas ginsenosidimutans]